MVTPSSIAGRKSLRVSAHLTVSEPCNTVVVEEEGLGEAPVEALGVRSDSEVIGIFLVWRTIETIKGMEAGDGTSGTHRIILNVHHSGNHTREETRKSRRRDKD